MEMDNYGNDFIRYCQYEKTLSNKTIKAYSIDLKQFMSFIRKSEKNKKKQPITRPSEIFLFIQRLKIRGDSGKDNVKDRVFLYNSESVKLVVA